LIRYRFRDRFRYPCVMERNTRQRTAIRDAIAVADRPLLPQEVLDAAQAASPGLGIATVYRNLKALLDEGEVCAVQLPGENPRYEIAAGTTIITFSAGCASGCSTCTPARAT
jgi:Fe2+ or Zn2+ uptake regulation protein